ncbi:hypothetical protein MMC07_001515 [Pseudocyphellaria aurata]|nr:hypothetical protein [Pseudocyphellaria aurata]
MGNPKDVKYNRRTPNFSKRQLSETVPNYQVTETGYQNNFLAELPSNVPTSETTDAFGNEIPGQDTDQTTNPQSPNSAEAAGQTNTNKIPPQKVDETTNLTRPSRGAPSLPFVIWDNTTPSDVQIRENLQYKWAAQSGTIIWDNDTDGGDQARTNYLNFLARQKVHPFVIVDPNIPVGTQLNWLYNNNGKAGANH